MTLYLFITFNSVILRPSLFVVLIEVWWMRVYECTCIVIKKSRFFFVKDCIEIRIIIKYISIFSPKGTKRYLNFTIEEGCHPNSPHVDWGHVPKVAILLLTCKLLHKRMSCGELRIVASRHKKKNTCFSLDPQMMQARTWYNT